MIRLLSFTNLYPSASQPRHGIFVEQRLRRLVESGRVTARVVVPVATRPFAHLPPPHAVERHGIEVRYVPFPAVRGLTTIVNPVTMALAARSTIAALRRDGGDFDVLDAHFLYPDGVAAVLLGRWLGKPVVITARGSDVNVAARERIAGACIRFAARRAAALIAVSQALRTAMIESGIAPSAITVLRNGVDLDTFKPTDRAAARAALGIAGPTLLSVGNLVPEKGHGLALEALVRLNDARLIVIGSGPEAAGLRHQAEALGVAARVRWLAPLAQQDLARYYGAADLTLLCSSREGMPNVLLESLACGTPVVATAVGGSNEIVTAPEAGKLVTERSATAIAAACRALIDAAPARGATRTFAERFGWSEPIGRQLELLERIAPRPADRRP